MGIESFTGQLPVRMTAHSQSDIDGIIASGQTKTIWSSLAYRPGTPQREGNLSTLTKEWRRLGVML
jgi:hypothetical protein